MRTILCVYAHPHPRKSRLNAAFRKKIEGLAGVEILDLYDTYPEFHIDLKKEKTRLLRNDVILLQHPFYWYSCPSLMKEWIDVALEKGFAYGDGGTALHGKYLVQAITTGGPDDAYDRTGYNHFSIYELLRPFEQTAYLCGMTPLKPFLTQGVGKFSAQDIEVRAEEYRQWVVALSTKDLVPYGTLK